MAWAWSTFGTLGLAVGSCSALLGLLVYLHRPRALQNRLLALVLATFGLAFATGGGLMYTTDDPRSTYAWQIVCWTVQMPLPALYLAFLSTLRSAFARPLVRARPALYALAAISPLAVPLAPGAWLVAVVPGGFSPWNVVAGPAFETFSLVTAATGVLGLVVAISAVRRTSPGSAARGQAFAYLAAFAVFDANSLAYLAYALIGFSTLVLYAQLALAFAFVLLLAYGVLKTQLFDIDLKVKWTLRRGTLASVFVAAFFVASAVAQQYLERYGVLVGGAAVGLLLFAFRPLERAADRFADRAMPHVRDDAEYRTVKKREVYRAALEGALEDGGVSDKERAMLARLAEQLGLGPVEMHEIERELAAEMHGVM